MPLKYNPKDAETAWPEGSYQAVLSNVMDTVSKSSGNPMQVLTFEVYDDVADRKQNVDLYVTASSCFWLRQLAGALNLAQQFKDGKFQADNHIDANVILALKIEKQDGYDDKNKISRISAPAPTNTAAEKVLNSRPRREPAMAGDNGDAAPSIKDDDIPF